MVGRFSFFGDMMAGLLERSPFRPAQGTGLGIEDLAHALISGRGEVSGKRVAQELLARYAALNQQEKTAFFHFLTTKMTVDTAAVVRAAEAYEAQPTGQNYQALAEAAEPQRQELLRRLNQAPGATLELVRMRLDLLNLLPNHPELAPLDVDFVHLFRSWFNRGFLVLRRIDWHTPANILEKIIQYEAVHAINDWDDLRRRLQPADRRCFAFFHPAMLEEPLIFVEVALCQGVPGSVQALLAEARDSVAGAEINTAVFYSISNCQEGLRGISFGNSLIKQVVEELKDDLAQLTTYVTLSPMPGFVKYLKSLDGNQAAAKILAAASKGDRKILTDLAPESRQLAADYLVKAKHPRGAPLDPVARFHLGNGALVHQVHAMADTSENGLRHAAGMMVNYLYDLAKVEANHEAFATENRVTTSKDIKALLQTGTAKGKTA